MSHLVWDWWLLPVLCVTYSISICLRLILYFSKFFDRMRCYCNKKEHLDLKTLTYNYSMLLFRIFCYICLVILALKQSLACECFACYIAHTTGEPRRDGLQHSNKSWTSFSLRLCKTFQGRIALQERIQIQIFLSEKLLSQK